MPIKKGDFIKISYTGRLKENNTIFDTTDEEIAKQEHITGRGPLGPQVICIGQGFVLHGLEEKLVGKEKGQHIIELLPMEAFGKKDAKLVRLFPTNKFLEQNVVPEPGMVVNIDEHMGVVRTCHGGRTTVDFNHPLASKEVVYTVDVLEEVTDTETKAKSIINHLFGTEVPTEVKEDKVTITLPKSLPEALTNEFSKRIMAISGAKDVAFVVSAPKKEESKAPQ